MFRLDENILVRFYSSFLMFRLPLHRFIPLVSAPISKNSWSSFLPVPICPLLHFVFQFRFVLSFPIETIPDGILSVPFRLVRLHFVLYRIEQFQFRSIPFHSASSCYIFLPNRVIILISMHHFDPIRLVPLWSIQLEFQSRVIPLNSVSVTFRFTLDSLHR